MIILRNNDFISEEKIFGMRADYIKTSISSPWDTRGKLAALWHSRRVLGNSIKAGADKVIIKAGRLVGKSKKQVERDLGANAIKRARVTEGADLTAENRDVLLTEARKLNIATKRTGRKNVARDSRKNLEGFANESAIDRIESKHMYPSYKKSSKRWKRKSDREFRKRQAEEQYQRELHDWIWGN